MRLHPVTGPVGQSSEGSSISATVRRFLPQSGTSRGSAILALGAAASQALMLAAAPILTRLYAPDEFGILAVFMALLGLIGAVASLRYQCAVPFPKTDEEAAPLLSLGFGIVMIVGGLSLAVSLAFGQTLARMLGTLTLAPFFWLLTVSIVLVGIYELLHYWALRRHAYEALAKTHVTRSALLVAVQLGGAGFGPISLLLGQATSQLVGVISLFWWVVLDRMSLIRAVRRSDILDAAVRYRRFPMFDTFYSLLGVFAAQMPALLLTGFFGPAAAGLFALTQRVLAAPIVLVGDPVNNAFFAAVPDAQRQGMLGEKVTRLHATMVEIATPVALAVMFAGPEVFAVVFGGAWRNSGGFAQWMALALYTQFLSGPLSSVFYALERQATAIRFQVASVVLRGSALMVGAWLGDLALAIALFALASAASDTLILGWVIRATGASAPTFVTQGLHAAMLGLGLTSPLALATFLQAGEVWFLIACGATATLIGVRFLQLARRHSMRAETLEIRPVEVERTQPGAGGKLLVLDMSYNLEEIRERQLLHSVTCRDLGGFFEHVWTVHPAATLSTSDAWGHRFGSPRHLPLNRRHTFVEGKVGRFAWLRFFPPLNFFASQIELVWHLRCLVRREHVTAIRAGSPLYTGLMGWIISRLTGVPLILRVAENYDRSYANTGKPMHPRIFRSRAIEKRVERFVLRHADLVAGVNQDNLNFALANGARRGRTALFRFGNLVDHRHFVDPARRESAAPLLAELGLGKEPFLIVIGRLVDVKRPADVVEVMGRLKARGLVVNVLFVGDGPLKEGLLARATDLGVAQQTIFCGNRDQDWLARVLPAAACVLSPLTGRALTEAALAAAPVAAYDTEWHSELIQPDITGELVAYPSIEAFAEAVIRLISDTARARRLGMALRERALDMMDPRRLDMVERGAYLALLAGRLTIRSAPLGQ